ncbi:MAG TPA: 3-dehydroquinate synthase [Halanaerobiaceae bacterium]|nr:3-dehydroquinate synthase [Bacillota bacterium]HHU92868.1 3-dehydroquinate synthase [Halanaerobiaceae bacterium]HOA41322.1 3-dehydroquinate synthase [Halanaerobiales bacterium]HPZ63490.1 3-dehydroquinate synthase [Halanaerobiales bacterium]HQD03969.1 3-dehydroquinate synthase [Halanaerobiales bacterium]
MRSEKAIEKIKIDLREEQRDYEIIIGAGLLNRLDKYIGQLYQGKKIFLVTDENVMKFYGEQVKEVLSSAGYEITLYVLPAGEEAKSSPYLKKGYDYLLENNFNRDNLILALGGGVVGDLAGFLAATFMRGIPFVQIPTTLLAQVDSSVGGKTAINHPRGKNLIGAFYQPKMVLIDPGFLQTLPVRELRTGLAEVLKYGFIVDRDLLDFMAGHREEILNLETAALTRIIQTSCRIKAAIVREDEKEKGMRALLNFGHTIGHALEAVTEYKKYTHGEAVAIGMVAAGELSRSVENLEKAEVDYLKELIRAYGLPLSCQYGEGLKEVYERLFYDKKVQKNKLRWILLKELGAAYIDEGVDNKIVKEVLEGIM